MLVYWTPSDFLDLGGREAVDKTLQRLARTGELRRIGRGLYDESALNSLTKKPTAPDYRELISVISRRDQSRMLINGMAAANDLGLTDAAPARIVVCTDARIRTLNLENLRIEFKLTAPSKLYWAGRPAIRVVQALHWLKDTLPSDHDSVMKRFSAILDDPKSGAAIRRDCRGLRDRRGRRSQHSRRVCSCAAAAYERRATTWLRNRGWREGLKLVFPPRPSGAKISRDVTRIMVRGGLFKRTVELSCGRVGEGGR